MPCFKPEDLLAIENQFECAPFFVFQGGHELQAVVGVPVCSFYYSAV